jgi:hypothetical protein
MPSVNFVESKIDLTLWIMEGNYLCKWVYCPLFQTKHNPPSQPPHSLVQLPKLHYGLWQAQVLLNGEPKRPPTFSLVWFTYQQKNVLEINQAAPSNVAT